MKVKLSELILLFFVFTSLASCRGNQIPEQNNSPPLVRISIAEERDHREEINGFGSLTYTKKFEVFSALDGTMDTLYFREGDLIYTGDLIAVINNPQVNLAVRRAEEAYSQALAALDIAMVRLRDSVYHAEIRLLQNQKSREELIQAEIVLEEERRKSRNREALYEIGGISDESIREERFRLDSLETQVHFMARDLEIQMVGFREEDLVSAGMPVPPDPEELRQALISLATMGPRAEAAGARANLESAGRELESSRLMEKELLIYSPGPGIVGARYVEEGERIKRDDRIITILETDSLFAVFPVPETEADKLEKGMSAVVSTMAGDLYEAVIDMVSPQADFQSLTFMVRVLIHPHNGTRLRPGMFARISIPVKTDNKMIFIPEAALSSVRDNTGRVFVLNNNILSERNLILGSRIGDEREILSGLTAGEAVILNPTSIHKEGLYVIPSN